MISIDFVSLKVIRSLLEVIGWLKWDKPGVDTVLYFHTVLYYNPPLNKCQ